MKKISLSGLLETIGQNLHSIRNARKETLQTVAASIGTSHPVLSKIENGRHATLQLALLVKLCNHYEVSLQQVLSLEQSQVFQLTTHNTEGDQKLIGQELADGYLLCIEQYKEQVEFLRKVTESYLKEEAANKR